MRLLDIIQREVPPLPWAEGDNIPWHDPAFSARMLAEHLSQEHDRASRRTPTIDRHVAWIHQTVLDGKPRRILDLGCGPGLYSHRLAQRGHACTAIDYSPASIAYAQEQAKAHGLDCTFHLGDIRQMPFGRDYDLALLIYGEFNVFRPADAQLLLRKAHDALRPGGKLLLEAHTFATIERVGRGPGTWHGSQSGLFSPDPYLALMDYAWDETQQTATIRYYIVDAAIAAVTRLAQTLQGYTDDAYHNLLVEHGFHPIIFYPGLAPDVPVDPDFCVILATKAAA